MEKFEKYLNRDMLLKLALALAVGGSGGVIAHFLHVPLGWMLGSMLATFVASMRRLPVAVPMRLRATMLGVLGVYLGSSFGPETLHYMVEWPFSMAAVVIYVPLMTAITAFFYLKVAGMDRATAVFSATPGGLTPMVVLGGAAGGDEQKIAVTQSLRVMVLVFSTPLMVFNFLDAPTAEAEVVQLISLADAAIIVVAVIAGILIARRIGMPAAEMTGAMFVTGGLYISGVVQGALPEWLLAVTLLVLGSAIGSRFSGIPRGVLIRLSGYAMVAIVLIFAVTAAVAAILSSLLGFDYMSVLLAFAPGGVAEMSLIAVALNVEPSFVAFHHVVRIFVILLLAPLLSRWLRQAPARQGD